MATSLDRRRALLTGSALFATAALSACDFAGAAISKLKADGAALIKDAAAAGNELATLVKDDADTIVAALPGITAGSATKVFQGMLGLTEQLLGTLLADNPLIATITTAMAAAEDVAKDIATDINAGSALTSASVQTGLTTLVAKTAALQAVIQPLGLFSVTPTPAATQVAANASTATAPASGG